MLTAKTVQGQPTVKWILIPLVLLLTVFAGYGIAVGQFVILYILAGVVLTIVLIRWPSWPMVIGYALIVPFWSYSLPYVGRSEKIIGIFSLMGLLILLQRKQLPKPFGSRLVMIGILILLGSYLLSWATHSWIEGASSYFLSLLMRIAFLFFAYFLLRTRKQVMWALGLFIASSFVPAIYTLFTSLTYGWGFQRTSLLSEIGYDSHSLGWSMLYSANQGGAAAILLLGLYPFVRRWRYRLAILSLTSFLFLMAFATQYRREMLITPVIIFLYLLIDKKLGLSRPAIVLLGADIAIFSLIFLPSVVFQQRLQETVYVIMGTETRLVSALAGFDVFMNSPLLGHGPSSYQAAVAPITASSGNIWAATPYNVFVWIAVEAGIFGLVSLVLVLLGEYRQGQRLREDLPITETWVFRCAPILVILFVGWFSFGNNWDLSQPWFLMGVILAAGRLTE